MGVGTGVIVGVSVGVGGTGGVLVELGVIDGVPVGTGVAVGGFVKVGLDVGMFVGIGIKAGVGDVVEVTVGAAKATFTTPAIVSLSNKQRRRVAIAEAPSASQRHGSKGLRVFAKAAAISSAVANLLSTESSIARKITVSVTADMLPFKSRGV